mmetsp:Transcript_9625/g.39601  ORF Transcript_9625/g.39601 Transcript_9625/m.39601 type:complete len:211 (+) Transcript_9625:436-1068(+)
MRDVPREVAGLVPRVIGLRVDAKDASVLVAGGEGVEVGRHAVGRHALRQLRGGVDAHTGVRAVAAEHLADDHQRHAVRVGPRGALEGHRQAQLVVRRVIVAHAHLRARPCRRVGSHQLVRALAVRRHALELLRDVFDELVVVHRASSRHDRARCGVVRLDVRLEVRFSHACHVLAAAQDGVRERRVLVRSRVQVVMNHLLGLLLNFLHLT